MVGGNIPGATETISIAIYDNVQALNYSAANDMALVLMAFSFVALSLTYAFNRRAWAVWPLHR
jgi:molybdate transport system permease protein